MQLTADHRAKALIIGYGNVLRGDDGVGRAVVHALACAPLPDAVETIDCHQLIPELAERLAAVHLVVFIDATGDLSPGRVEATEALPRARAPHVAHRLDASGLLDLSQRLYGRSPKAFLVRVGIGSMMLGEEFSEPVTAAVPRAIDLVLRLLADTR